MIYFIKVIKKLRNLIFIFLQGSFFFQPYFHVCYSKYNDSIIANENIRMIQINNHLHYLIQYFRTSFLYYRF